MASSNSECQRPRRLEAKTSRSKGGQEICGFTSEWVSWSFHYPENFRVGTNAALCKQDHGHIKILLVGEDLNQHSHFAQRLACWGADLQCVPSCSQACVLLKEQAFDLVVSRLKLVDGSALQMVPLLDGSPTALFCSQPVADGCWWMPVVEVGRVCWGAPGLRAKEFGELLHRRVTTTRGSAQGTIGNGICSSDGDG